MDFSTEEVAHRRELADGLGARRTGSAPLDRTPILTEPTVTKVAALMRQDYHFPFAFGGARPRECLKSFYKGLFS
jgi:hypothetical protein